jgi:hypothetical protein
MAELRKTVFLSREREKESFGNIPKAFSIIRNYSPGGRCFRALPH